MCQRCGVAMCQTDTCKAGQSLLVSAHLGAPPRQGYLPGRSGQVYSHIETEKDVGRGRMQGDPSIRKNGGECQEGELKSPPRPYTGSLRDVELVWPCFPKEYRCLTWSQMDFTGTLSLAIFTKDPARPPLPPQSNQVHLERQRAWPPLTPPSI